MSENDRPKKMRFARQKERKPVEEHGFWKLLIVDDEEDVHSVTKLTLNGFIYNNRRLNFLHAFSADEARKLLEDNPDVCVVLLDVVMETHDAGLQLTEHIRKAYPNSSVRIILRTGQPGYAPEREMIDKYDINDYKTKTELTSVKLHTLMKSSLRTYEALETVETYNKRLEKMVEDRTSELRKAHDEIVRLEKRNAIFATIVTANHELNQPLMVLKGNTQMLQMSLKEMLNDKQTRYFNRIEESIQRISSILNKFKSQDFHFEDYSEQTQMVVFHDQEDTSPEKEEE